MQFRDIHCLSLVFDSSLEPGNECDQYVKDVFWLHNEFEGCSACIDCYLPYFPDYDAHRIRTGLFSYIYTLLTIDIRP